MNYESPESFERSDVINYFCQDFKRSGFDVHPSVDITSGVDPTVRLIGAPISVLKPYLESARQESIAKYIVQNCVRTHNLRTLFEIAEPQAYGSFFTGLGALTTDKSAESLFNVTSQFLHDRLGVKDDECFISVDSQDEDMLDAAERNGRYRVRPDVEKPSYYDHTYGMEGVSGRNSSYWVANRSTGVYEDIGNVITIEDRSGPLGVEFAFGDTTLVKQLSGLDHVLDAYGIEIADNDVPLNIRTRLADCAITSIALLSEGLRPGAQSNQTRLLRTYMKGLSLFRRLADVDIPTLEEKLETLESDTLPLNPKDIGKYTIKWIVDYEAMNAEGKLSNKEDITIATLLNKTI